MSAAAALPLLGGALGAIMSRATMSKPTPPPMPVTPPPPSPTQAEMAATAGMGTIQPGQLTSNAYLDMMAGRGFGPGTTMVGAATSPSLDSKILQDIYSRLGF